MAQANTETSSKPQPATPAREVVAELARNAARGAGEQLGGMVTRLVSVLLDLTTAGDDAQSAYRRTRAGNLLKTNSYAFIHLAGEALARHLDAAAEELAPASKPDADLDSLSLVPIEVMDSKVAFGALCRPFEIAHSEVLASLCVRLGLLLGRDVLRPAQNPLRPDLFLTAIHEAWCAFEPDTGSHDLLLPLLRPDIFLDLGELLDAADKELRARNKQARERFHISKSSDTARARRSGMDAALAQQLRNLLGGADGEPAVPLIPELPNMPQGSGWRPSSALGFAVAAPAVAAAPQDASASVPAQAGVNAGATAGTDLGTHAGISAGIIPGHFAGNLVGNSTGTVAATTGTQVGAPFGVQTGPATGQAQAGVPALGQGTAPMAPAGTVAGVQLIPAGPSVSTANGAAAVPGFVVQLAAPGMPAAPGFVSALAGVHAASMQGAAPARMPAAVGAPASLLDLLASMQLAQPGLPTAGRMDAANAPSASHAGHAAGASVPHQVFYLPRLKQSLPQGSLSRGEENTLDLLSRIFETVLLDDNIPLETRELIRFLQVPVLKAALLDQNFFFEETHPARRMIDLLSRMGWEQRQAPDDPVLQAMRRGVDRIGRTGGEAGAEPQAFAEAVAEVEAQLAAEERAAEAAIAQPIARATKLEKQTVAGRSARKAVALRLGDAELVATVSAFLDKRWVDVLTFAYLIDEERPGAVENATQTMDELIWTVKPKATQEQRKALIAKLPPLLTALNKWLDAIKWQDADRLQFFAELAECHLQIVRAPIELSPERQLELAVEAAQQDALRRIALEQASIEQEREQEQGALAGPAGEGRTSGQRTHDEMTPDNAAPKDAAISTVDELERGMRLEFRERDGSVRKVKLAWVSPLRTLFIFSGAARQESFSLPAEKLVEAVRCGSIRVLAVEGVVGRVLTEAMQEAVNDPGPKRAAG
ncbi:DUF1631 domain-containing protein [Massilia sp. IC2-278]|uniref:DUF1631 family protein n=1 Tax=Massilia sp. IC2-278 TaxID=2887200 RepID=UPI001E528473|nr:DUF1631 family protein [Massilia sp. IC2-278]MCC2963364.1 DUF1631 domain-containing protein [Massilia sp. IC2-278]